MPAPGLSQSPPRHTRCPGLFTEAATCVTTQVYSHHHQVFQGAQEDHGDPWDPTNKIREFKRWLEGEGTKSVDRALGFWKLVPF